MRKFIKYLFSCEPLIIWLRYFYTLKIKNAIINFGLPLLVCLLLGFLAKDYVQNSNVDILTISAILIGFCSSILIMLLTLNGGIAEKLNTAKLDDSIISLRKALIYKFVFILYNLICLVIMNLIINVLGVSNMYYYTLISFGVLLNALLIIIEAFSNTVFCLIPTAKY